MPHLKRAVVLLSLVLILVFIGPRVIPIPAFLADFGFHEKNTEKNIEEWTNLPIQYAGSSICTNCHPDKYSLWTIGTHRTINCETCHGPAKAHLETGAPEVLDTSRRLCGLCHTQLISRPSDFPQVDMETMGGDAECITCHDPHDPRAGMPPQVPHALEERTECQSCHASHEPFEAIPPQLPHALEGRTECLSCHGPPEVRGATLPHPPHSLEGRSDCLLCHQIREGIKPLSEDHAGRKSATCLNCHRRE